LHSSVSNRTSCHTSDYVEISKTYVIVLIGNVMVCLMSRDAHSEEGNFSLLESALTGNDVMKRHAIP
jgi:hypothetical protein